MENAAFYQNFFQYDTLFRVTEEEILVEEPEAEPIVAEEEKSGPVVAKALLPDDPEIEAPGVEIIPATPTVEEAEQLTPQPEPTRPVAQFPPLKHKILVLVEEKTQPELQATDATLLDNILKATGHSIDEVDILNIATLPKANAQAVVAAKSTHYFIAFGVPLIKLQIDLLFQPYAPRQVEGIWFLLADPLSVIDADKSKKKQLWGALKQMFAVG